MKLYALSLFLGLVAVMLLTAALTGCGLRAGTVQAERDALTETGTVKIATSGPVAAIKADVDAALVKTEKKIERTVNAARDSIEKKGITGSELTTGLAVYMLISKSFDAFRDWLNLKRRMRP